jgi:hypothetical protein
VKEFRARIGRVRMKGGGADVRVIEGFAIPRGESASASLAREARECLQAGDIAAFVFLAISPEGRCHFAYRYESGCPLSRNLLPSYIEELTRTMIVTRAEASKVFDDMFEWRDGGA